MNSIIGFKKLSSFAFLPTRGSPYSAGLDLKSPYEVIIPKHGKALLLTDLAVQLPQNCYGRIASRSGLAFNNFIEVAGGVVDQDYTGNVGVILYNHSDQDYTVRVGDKIAQLICEVIMYPSVVEIFKLQNTQRNVGGLGSTGR